MFDLSVKVKTHLGQDTTVQMLENGQVVSKEVDMRDLIIYLLWNVNAKEEVNVKIKRGILADKMVAMPPQSVVLSPENVETIKDTLASTYLDTFSLMSIYKVIDPISLKE